MKTSDEYLTLSELLAAGRPKRDTVCSSSRRIFCWNDFRSAVTILKRKLEQEPGLRWGLYCEDGFDFAVGFFGLLHAGKTIILPPNAQKGTIRQIAAMVDGFVARKSIHASEIPLFEPVAAKIPDNEKFKVLDADRTLLELFTSGSTGKPKIIRKNLSQLESEVAVLESMWGKQMERCTVFSTVPHQHIYGLLFKVLWPLASARSFHTDTFIFPEKLAQAIDQNGNSALISCPAHLRRFPSMVDFNKIKSHLRIIFSSGGPLPERISLDLQSILNMAPIEVLGSSETGGVAWAKVNKPGQARVWTPFPEVKIKTSQPEGVLSVNSPFAGTEKGAWYSLGDCGELFQDGTFLLKGRREDIVKIEEKRVSLRQMEMLLCGHDFVQEAVIIVINKNRLWERMMLGAVLVLSEKGKMFLTEKGKWKLNEKLKNVLRHYVEQVAVPKKWRYVDALPANAMGKSRLPEIVKLFEEGMNEHSRSPEIIKERKKDGEWFIVVRIPENLVYFSGHFPERPVLPGVVQVSWVIELAAKKLGIVKDFREIESLKFRNILHPGMQVTISLSWNSDAGKLMFRIEKEEMLFSAGTVVFG
jgi:acyl-coenzyme A synthetase/AMP-(fatty) acid ligase/3-hydroxymyristoyl/3-hydroxydecanoyl-(acyl carrier protein) dehydratase